MVTIGMNYNVIEGKQEAFVAMWNKVLEIMNGIDGHGTSFLYCEVNDPCSYLIMSEWTSKDAFDAFIASDTFKKVADWGKEQILTGRPKHEVYGQDAPTAAAEGGCPVSH